MKLHYKKLGEHSSNLLILHGVYGSGDNWISLGKRLAENHTVYLIDQRNHGRSPWSDEFDYHVLSRDIVNFIEEHQLRNVSLMGHSMGGKVVINIALNHPELIDSAVVVDMALKHYNIDHHKRYLLAMNKMPIASMNNRTELDDHLKTDIESFGIRQFLLKNVKREENGKFGWKLNLDVIGSKIERIGGSLDGGNLQFDKPALFVRGGNSNYVRPEDYNTISTHFRRANIGLIEGAGHWVHADKPEALYELLRWFFEQNLELSQN